MNFASGAWEHGWQIVGWTMLSFLAAGSVVLVLLGVLRFLLTRAQPRIRYATTLAGFAVLALLPVGIAGYLSASRVVPTPIKFATSSQIEFANPLLNAEVAEVAKTDLSVAESTEDTERTFGERATAVSGPDGVDFGLVLHRAVDYLPWVWVLGTPLTFLLLASGLIGAERMRTASRVLSEGPVYEACQQIRTALRMGREVGIAVCESVVTPLLVGVVRPLILLPPAALNGWTTDELEMVLLHELAHVRRWDNAINLVQRIVEALLFFHPAVWIVSGWVRRDREDCCDAVVVAHTAKPQAYAELLLSLASNQPLAGLAASAMAGHPVASRIRRILKLEDEKMLVSRKGMFLCASTVIAIILCASFLTPSEAEEAPTKVSREAKRVEDERSTPAGTTKNTNDTKKDLTTEDTESTEKTNSPFPTLEEQRAADFAYKLLGVELERLTPEELELVKTAGYQGGMKVTHTKAVSENELPRTDALHYGDIMVGLHVWPTESHEQVEEILKRYDMHELSPLKFYVLRRGSTRGGGGGGGGGFGGGPPSGEDEIVTGRIPVDLDAWAEKEGFKQERLKQSRSQSDPPTAQISTGTTDPAPGPTDPGPATSPTAQPRYSVEIDRQSTLLYDGKTFDECRNLWKTELKTERRIECIKALAAFGRAGKSKEAAEAILDVAGEYDFHTTDSSDVGRLKQSVVELLASNEDLHLPERDWLPMLVERLAAEPAKYHWLAWNLIASLRAPDSSIKPVLLELLENSERNLREIALSQIFYSPTMLSAGEKEQLIQETLKEDPIVALRVIAFQFLDYVEEKQAIEFLLSEQEQLQIAARDATRWLKDKSKATHLAESLLAILSDPQRQKEHLAMIRALAAIGYPALAAERVLTKIIESTDDEELMIAAAHARERITLEKGIIRRVVTDETKNAMLKSDRWGEYTTDESHLKEAINAEAIRSMGDNAQLYPQLGGDGGGFGGGGGAF